MSQVLKSSLALAAVLASAMTMSACSKNSDGNKTEFSNAETSKSQVPADAAPELKAAMAASDCPFISGQYKVAGSDEVITYGTSVVTGGIEFSAGAATLTVDGAEHADTETPGGKYTASCNDQLLTVARTSAKGVKSTFTATFNESNELVMFFNNDGAVSTRRLTKEQRPVSETPLISEEEIAKQGAGSGEAMQAILNMPFPAFTAGPEEVAAAVPEAQAVEAASAPAAAPAATTPETPEPAKEAGGREDLRPMPTKSSSSGSSQGVPKGQEIPDPSQSPERF